MGEYKIDIHHPLTVVSANSCYPRARGSWLAWRGNGVGGRQADVRPVCAQRDDPVDSDVHSQ